MPGVNVTTAACSLVPNAEDPTSAGSRAVVLTWHPGHCNRCVRCSTNITLIGGSSAT